MSIVANGLQPHDFIAQAQPYPTNFTRATVTIVQDTSNNLKAGRVLGRITATGNYTRLTPSATDGSQTAAGVLLTDVDATTASQQAVAIVNGDAYLIESKLEFGTPVASEIQAAKNDLIARGFKFVNEGDVYSY